MNTLILSLSFISALCLVVAIVLVFKMVKLERKEEKFEKRFSREVELKLMSNELIQMI